MRFTSACWAYGPAFDISNAGVRGRPALPASLQPTTSCFWRFEDTAILVVQLLAR
jgi:hypothetical protein